MESFRSHSIVWWLGIVCLIAGAVLIIGYWVSGNSFSAQNPVEITETSEVSSPTPSIAPTWTADPLVPTRTTSPTLAPVDTATATSTSRPALTPTSSVVEATTEPGGQTATSTVSSSMGSMASITPTPVPNTATPQPMTATPLPTSTDVHSLSMVPPEDQYRLGVSLPYGATRDYGLSALHIGWVMDWAVRAQTVLPPGVDYAQTVRMWKGELKPGVETLTAVASARPGSLWLISNEPDVRWQDNVVPEVYARFYHEAYHAIKLGDPSAIVAAGGIAQATPLRLRYLDLVLQSYREQFGEALPAQAWQIHNYMLREERDSWGVDIPPGLPDNTGKLYSIEDSGNLDLFRQQIYAFREWMASRGYGGYPLYITEFGIPMPPDYGFPTQRAARFLEETWRFFLTASDPALGDPTDGGRLVQRWCWFSLGTPDYPTGSLIDTETGNWTPFAQAWFDLVGE